MQTKHYLESKMANHLLLQLPHIWQYSWYPQIPPNHPRVRYQTRSLPLISEAMEIIQCTILNLLGISTLPCPFFAGKITTKDQGLAFPFSLLINPCTSTGSLHAVMYPLLGGTVNNKLFFQGSCLCHLAIPD